jgi:hypothetical protein
MYQKDKVYIQFFGKHKNDIPNIDRLTKILKSDPKPGHLVHAECVKRFFESKVFKITDIEVKNTNTDVDIELNGSINIQVWHGASVSTHNIVRGKVSNLGGVKTDYDKDEEKIKKKLIQLPDTKPGFLICYNYHMGIVVLPEWENAIKDNKAIIELFHSYYGNGIQNEAWLYCSNGFKHIRLADKIALALGFGIRYP